MMVAQCAHFCDTTASPHIAKSSRALPGGKYILKNHSATHLQSTFGDKIHPIHSELDIDANTGLLEQATSDTGLTFINNGTQAT